MASPAEGAGRRGATGSGARTVALVTGASRGIGQVLAAALAHDGWAVAMVARDPARLGAAVAPLQEEGCEVVAAPADVTAPDEVAALAEQVRAELGPVDLLVNNAGRIETETVLWETDPQLWWDVVQTNVRGPFLLTHAVVPSMIARGGGRVININTGSSTRDSADYTAYAASKSALARITGGTHLAGFDRGIRAFDLAPGVVRTDMTASMPVHDDRTEWTDPEQVAELALALASGELDAWSGRMVRAGVDTVAELQRRAAAGLPEGARTLRLRPWGADDPLGS
ncbi:MAG TPA: SDR family oxidoreductase [Segeticoccus sp.]|uniref:SDR family NAD(P)-dependent oxidoreductase n=1 Tax=Segeticoccus sp. TaxID=2706531 RepID=UPI002D80D453|nr:SDR family oxidoreductase [Segeticoccus sp.]HET8600707.1 SDR family oxidoreductase [Segeticoccus sp.]